MKLKVKHLSSWKEKLTGLTGLKKVYPVYFETRFGIHTFGMEVLIDIFILDSKDKIICIKKNLKPGKIFFWNPKFYKVLETPVNFIHAGVGDAMNIR